MNRSDLQILSDYRVREAQILFEHGCFDGAYYLLGYAIECALKSCITKQIKAFELPDKKLVNDIYTHDLEKLLNLSGLKPKLDSDAVYNPDLKINWAVVKDWSEQSRYQHGMSWHEIQDFFKATTDQESGILTWLKNWW